MSRIYLEAKIVYIAGMNSGDYHLYLVQRDDPAPGQRDSLTWRQSGEVLRGFVVQTGDLSRSNDAYKTQDDVYTRLSVDITDSLASGAWDSMAATLATITSGYSYELPVARADAMDHVTNSNAVIF